MVLTYNEINIDRILSFLAYIILSCLFKIYMPIEGKHSGDLIILKISFILENLLSEVIRVIGIHIPVL